MSDTHALAAMIASRICHDLISPLGAISNGVELLQLTQPAEPPPELDLIAQSSRSATARTRFLRLAFGMAGEGQQVSRAELAQTLSDWASGGRVDLDWQADEGCSRPRARRLCLGILCLEAALPMGGRLEARAAGEGWLLHARGRRVRMAPDLWDMLTEPQASVDLSPGRVQFALLRHDLLQGPGLATGEIAEDTLVLRLP